VWFLWEGGEILVYSVKGSLRVRNLAMHPKVALHLNSTPRGGDVVTLEGEARLDPGAPSSADVPAYAAKYRAMILESGWTPESFARDYPDAIRVRVTRATAG
jgi:PPOX class probable F420-dependent enzyme